MKSALFGLLVGGFLGGIVGAVALGLVGALIAEEFYLFIVAVVAGGLLGGTHGAMYGMLHGAFIGASRGPRGDHNASWQSLAGRMTVIHLVCLGTVTMLAVYLWSVQAVNLPDPSEVQNITVSYFEFTGALLPSIAGEIRRGS
jgi:hypothetical protein